MSAFFSVFSVFSVFSCVLEQGYCLLDTSLFPLARPPRNRCAQPPPQTNSAVRPRAAESTEFVIAVQSEGKGGREREGREEERKGPEESCLGCSTLGPEAYLVASGARLVSGTPGTLVE